jgi:hypothetical protein
LACLQIQGNLSSLINRENAEKDNAKVTLAQNEGASDVSCVQTVNYILVLFEAFHNISETVGCRTEQEQKGKQKK